MRRVLETYGGSSDIVHVMKLNTGLSEMIRPASKLTFLEANLE